MSTSRPQSRFTEIADSISGVRDPSMGDERERDVILRAYTFSSVVATYAAFAVAILLAVIGVGLWSVLVVLAAGLTGWGAIWYCARNDVDLPAMTERTTGRRRRVTYSSMAVLSVLWVAALLFHVLTGAPLVPVDLGFPGPSDNGFATVAGALVGGAGGIAAVIVAFKLTSRSIRKREQAAEDED